MSNNRVELGEHVYNSKADAVAARTDYFEKVRKATKEEITQMGTRNGLMAKCEIPPLSNHKAFIDRYGYGDINRGYFAWKAFHEVKATFKDARADEDGYHNRVEKLDEILRQKDANLKKLKADIQTAEITVRRKDLPTGVVLHEKNEKLFSTNFFKTRKSKSIWSIDILFLNSEDYDSWEGIEQMRLRELFAVNEQQREEELCRREREAAEEKYRFFEKNTDKSDNTFRLENDRKGCYIMFHPLTEKGGGCGWYLRAFLDIEFKKWEEVRDAKNHEYFLVIETVKSGVPIFHYMGNDRDEAKRVHQQLIEEDCKIRAEKRRKSGSKKAAVSKSKSITAKEATENLKSVKMKGYDKVQYHTESQILSTYGLKCIQFGNASATRKDGKMTPEHKEYLARLEEFLQVIADIFGILPEDMGQIVRSYAWGARGHGGGQMTFVAHYEGRGHLDNIVNATRRRGHDGSHAHEFGHGLDYFLAWCYLRVDKDSVTKLENKQYVDLPPACRELVNFLNNRNTAYSRACAKMDAGKEKTYFSEPTEKFARAFATFIEDELESRGITAPFAVSAKGETVHPEGEEREKCNKLFRAAIDEVIERGHLRPAVTDKKTEEDISIAAAVEWKLPDYKSDKDGQLRLF